MDPSNSKSLSPTIYLDEMYELYTKCDNLPEVMGKIAESFNDGIKYGDRFEGLGLNRDDVKDKIVFQLINADFNKELIEGVPHRSFKDLEVIYRLVVEKNTEAVRSAIITNELAGSLGLSEQELFDLAVDNTKRINPVKIVSMHDMMKSIMSQQDFPEEAIDVVMDDMVPENQMYIISNESGMNGAVSMLYEDEMHDLAEKVGDSLYILPSSVHEVLAVPASINDNAEMLADMVYEINMNVLSLEDRLSNQVYFYNKDLRTLDIATDSPHKSIGGDVSEKVQSYITKPKKI